MSKNRADDCKTVCLFLGPYRNLTTLTSAMLHLHPNCQVLNHGRERIFENNKVNFLEGFEPEVLENFIHYAIKISKSGRRGKYGGSITHSHAFDVQYETRNIYKENKVALVKSRINSLVWKESLEVYKKLKVHRADLGKVLERNKKLRFLYPVRNPMDCAVSNKNTGHIRLFLGLTRESSKEEALDSILEEFRYFLDLYQEFPEHFFHFYAHAMNARVLGDISTFLELESNVDFLENTLSIWDIEASHYQHEESFIELYKSLVIDKFRDFPEVREQLYSFL